MGSASGSSRWPQPGRASRCSAAPAVWVRLDPGAGAARWTATGCRSGERRLDDGEGGHPRSIAGTRLLSNAFIRVKTCSIRVPYRARPSLPHVCSTATNLVSSRIPARHRGFEPLTYGSGGRDDLRDSLGKNAVSWRPCPSRVPRRHRARRRRPAAPPAVRGPWYRELDERGLRHVPRGGEQVLRAAASAYPTRARRDPRRTRLSRSTAGARLGAGSAPGPFRPGRGGSRRRPSLR